MVRRLIMMGMRTASTVLVLVLLVPSCMRLPETAAWRAHALQTDKERYTLAPGVYGLERQIVARFTNLTDAPVYIGNCWGATGWSLQRRVGSDWVESWGGITEACASDPIVVLPGESHVRVFRVARTEGVALYPRMAQTDLEPGTYRLVLHSLYASRGPERHELREPLPLKHRISNPFAVAAPADLKE
jgi:hypothetical protein